MLYRFSDAKVSNLVDFTKIIGEKYEKCIVIYIF